jgi:hypothetical protein
LARFTKEGAGATLVSAQATTCAERVVLDLTWNNVNAMQEPLAVFVHGMDTSGQRVAVADRDPVGGLLPLNEIPAGIQVNERRTITTTTSTPAITQVQIGIYSRADGQRYQAAHADGSLWDGASVVVPVTSKTDAAVCDQ